MSVAAVFAAAPTPLLAQGIVAGAAPVSTGGLGPNTVLDLDIYVRDTHGNLIDAQAAIHITSDFTKYNAISAAKSASPARFHRLTTDEYDIAVTCARASGRRNGTSPWISDGIRSWKTNKRTYDIPLKGRIWISSVNFSVVRVETDLREPVKGLQLTRDHLNVDSGPVDFAAGSKQPWLR